MIKLVPNCLTITRFFAPFILTFLFSQSYYLCAILVCLLTSFTDFLDGYIARKYNCQTQFGSIADPLADKFFVIYTLLFFFNVGLIPKFLIIAIVLRDFLILIGAVIHLTKNKNIKFSPLFISKINTAFQMCLIFIIILNASVIASGNGELGSTIVVKSVGFIKYLFIGLVSFTTVLSCIHYLIYFLRYRKQQSPHINNNTKNPTDKNTEKSTSGKKKQHAKTKNNSNNEDNNNTHKN